MGEKHDLWFCVWDEFEYDGLHWTVISVHDPMTIESRYVCEHIVIISSLHRLHRIADHTSFADSMGIPEFKRSYELCAPSRQRTWKTPVHLCKDGNQESVKK